MSFYVMSAITAEYGPEDDQSFRSSDNIDDWNTPKGGRLKFVTDIPDGYPQPTFVIEHDVNNKKDVRWYENISNGTIIDVDSGKGESGKHSVYIGTSSKLPSGLDKHQKYSVTILAENP